MENTALKSFLKGKKVLLTVIDKNDETLRIIADFRNSPEFGKFIGRTFPFDPGRVLEDISLKDKVFLGIALVEKPNELIGFITLRSIHFINRTAKITIFIASGDNHKKGIGSETIGLLLEYAFRVLNLRKVNADVFDFNEPSLNCFKKLGFQEQGVMKAEYYIDGAYRDDILLCIFREDWEKKN